MDPGNNVKKNLFDVNCIKELKQRIATLNSNTTPNWGNMTVAQMLAHCSEVLKNALGETQQKRKLIGYIVAPFVRSRFYDAEPYKKKGGPSTFIMEDDKNFEYEKQYLLQRIEQFHQIERAKLKKSVHPILGKFTPEQWAIGQYKHLDHHLRQFGV